MAGLNLTETSSYSANVVGPVAGEKVTAASVRVMGTDLANRTKYLKDVVSDGAKTIACGELDAPIVVASTLLQSSGNQAFTGTQTFSGTAALTWTLSAGTTIAGNAATEITLPGITRLTGRTVVRAPVYKTDASFILNRATGANRIIMLTAPAGNRIITLQQSTAPVPEDGDWFEVTVMLGTSAFTVGLQREGSSDYVAVLGDGVGGAGNQVATARVELIAGVWRLVSVGGRYVFYGVDS